MLSNKSGTPALGERELSALEILWSTQPLSAQQVLEKIPAAGIGLSTMQSTLERLHRKQLVARTKQGRAYIYRPLIRREDIISSLLDDISREIAGGDMAAMISGFMTYMGEDASKGLAVMGEDASKGLAVATPAAKNSDQQQNDD